MNFFDEMLKLGFVIIVPVAHRLCEANVVPSFGSDSLMRAQVGPVTGAIHRRSATIKHVPCTWKDIACTLVRYAGNFL